MANEQRRLDQVADRVLVGAQSSYEAAREALRAVDHRPIWLEATERGPIDVERARRTMPLARSSGYAIDDFGTGYSRLQCLQSLPLDALKIDSRSSTRSAASRRPARSPRTSSRWPAR